MTEQPPHVEFKSIPRRRTENAAFDIWNPVGIATSSDETADERFLSDYERRSPNSSTEGVDFESDIVQEMNSSLGQLSFRRAKQKSYSDERKESAMKKKQILTYGKAILRQTSTKQEWMHQAKSKLELRVKANKKVKEIWKKRNYGPHRRAKKRIRRHSPIPEKLEVTATMCSSRLFNNTLANFKDAIILDISSNTKLHRPLVRLCPENKLLDLKPLRTLVTAKDVAKKTWTATVHCSPNIREGWLNFEIAYEDIHGRKGTLTKAKDGKLIYFTHNVETLKVIPSLKDSDRWREKVEITGPRRNIPRIKVDNTARRATTVFKPTNNYSMMSLDKFERIDLETFGFKNH